MSTMTQDVERQSPETNKTELKEERTVQGRFYLPPTDIVETEKELRVVMDMPGVRRENVTVNLDKDILKVEGFIDTMPYAKVQPIYSEYNVGHYARSFTISKAIDRERIEATLREGVLTLILPKAAEAQPRQIPIQ